MVKTYSNNGRESKQSPWFPATKHQWLLNQSQCHVLHHHGTAPYGTCFCCLGPHLQKDIRQLEREQRRAARLCHGDYTNRTPGCVDDMLKVLHWDSLETRRKNNRLSLLHKINTGHVDITLDQYIQRSDPRTRAAQRFRHAMAGHPALCHSFPPATVRQWNRLPTSLSAQRLSCLNICFNFFMRQYTS